MKTIKQLTMLSVLALLTFGMGCREEPTVGDRIRDVGDGIGDAIEEVGDEIDDAKKE